jgi:hypothetical protein
MRLRGLTGLPGVGELVVRRNMTPRHHPTPDEVLAILVDQHRHQSQVDPEAEPDAILTFDSSIADWRLACDLVGWRGLGRALNDEWGMSLSLAEWRDVLEPPDRKTLRTLCHTISHAAAIESLPTRGFFGCGSPDSRAFRAVREVLIRLGVPRDEIRSSTPIMPLLSKYGWRFLSPCLRIAPGALPALKHVGKLHRFLLISFGVFMVSGIVLGLFKSPLAAWSMIFGLASLLALWIPHPRFRGFLVIPGIATLGDLAACLGRNMTGERGAAPNGGPATRLGNSGVTGGPPSVS